MAYSINEKAGTVAAVPGLNLARLVSKASPSYQSQQPAAIELAAHKIAARFVWPHAMARTVAELAGLGGRT
jgi:hypothetical protein